MRSPALRERRSAGRREQPRLCGSGCFHEQPRLCGSGARRGSWFGLDDCRGRLRARDLREGPGAGPPPRGRRAAAAAPVPPDLGLPRRITETSRY